MIDPEMLAILACPACRAPLATRGEDRLQCQSSACGLIYRIEDEIPILLVDEAIAPGDDAAGRSLDS